LNPRLSDLRGRSNWAGRDHCGMSREGYELETRCSTCKDGPGNPSAKVRPTKRPRLASFQLPGQAGANLQRWPTRLPGAANHFSQGHIAQWLRNCPSELEIMSSTHRRILLIEDTPMGRASFQLPGQAGANLQRWPTRLPGVANHFSQAHIAQSLRSWPSELEIMSSTHRRILLIEDTPMGRGGPLFTLASNTQPRPTSGSRRPLPPVSLLDPLAGFLLLEGVSSMRRIRGGLEPKTFRPARAV
jgi:hypothetical protein